MIVVADTSPINYLLQIGEIEILPRLYDRILLPHEVREELLDPAAPGVVNEWALDLPTWVQLREPTMEIAGLEHLGAGERAALQLAVETHASVILADERKARYIAESRFGLVVTGTLGVLLNAHFAGYIDGLTVFERLCSETNFHHSSALKQVFMTRLRSQ